jgi:lipoprotein-releasing system ATP-binding protein
MILKARNIVKSYPKLQVLSNISLDVGIGESVAICGRSGEGKTTLLHILGTLEEPDSGEIEIAGRQLTRSNAPLIRNQQIGFIFQAYNLLEDFTTLENVLMPARIARRPATRQKGLELLSLVGLTDRADFPAKLLSGGERQRVAIARALCNDPALILADEPSGNLDRANAKKIGELLLSLNKALILVTHDPDLAALCNRRYLLKDGQLN